MVAAAQAVLAKVVGQPLQVGGREVHAGGGGRAADAGLHGGGAGVAEQVEEALAAGLGGDAGAQRPVVEEHPGVQVIEQVHPQPRRALAHQDELAAGVHAPVLAAALAAGARLDGDALLREFEDLARGGQQVSQSPPGRCFRDTRRRRVFLHVQPALARRIGLGIDVNGGRIFGQVGIVGAKAVHAFAGPP